MTGARWSSRSQRSRAHANVPAFLGEYTGILVSDGYGAYNACVKARDGAVRQQNCWIHTRRNAWEQKDAYPDMADAMLEMIGELYAIEEEITSRPASERLAARQTRSRAVVDRIWAWCERTLKDPALTPKHPIRKAIEYAVERKTTLELSLDNPGVPLDSNRIYSGSGINPVGVFRDLSDDRRAFLGSFLCLIEDSAFT